METTTISESTTTTGNYTITTNDAGNFIVLRDGQPLRDVYGNTRWFTSRNAARKRISRERKGNFHN